MSRSGNRYETSYSWSQASDGFNFCADSTIHALGTNEVVTRSENWLDVDSAGSVYFNELAISHAIIDTTTGTELARREYEYYASDTAVGYAGQLKSVTDYVKLEGVGNGTRQTSAYYYYGDTAQGYGNPAKIVTGEGDSVQLFYDCPLDTAAGEPFNLSFNVVEMDGTSSPRHELVDNFKTGFATIRRFLNKPGGAVDTLHQHRAYDRFGRTVRIVDANGSLHVYDYDEIGRILQVQSPLSFEPLATADTVIDSADLRGASAEYIYDDVAGDGSYTHVVTNVHQEVVDTSGGAYEYDGMLTTLEFDGLNRNTQVSFDNGNGVSDSIETRFDQGNRITKVTDQLASSSAFEYDKRGRLARTTFPDVAASRASKAYGSTSLSTLPALIQQNLDMDCGFLFLVIDTNENGNVATSYMDAMSQVRATLQVVDSDSIWTILDYDKLGNLRKIVRPEGDSVLYWHNSLGELTKSWSTDQDTSWYKYDRVGRLRLMKNGNLDDDVFEDSSMVASATAFGTDSDTMSVTVYGRVYWSLAILDCDYGQSEATIYLNGSTEGNLHDISCCSSGCTLAGTFDVMPGDVVVAKTRSYDAEPRARAFLYVYEDADDWLFRDYDALDRMIASGKIRLDEECDVDSCWLTDTLSQYAYRRWFYDQDSSLNSTGLFDLAPV